MQIENASYPKDLESFANILIQLSNDLLKRQAELEFQINRLSSVKIKDIVNKCLKELNNLERNDINTFEDLLTLNAKLAIKSHKKSV